MKTFFILVNFSCFLQKVVSLSLTVQSNTFASKPSLCIWMRQPADGNKAINFDLRFVQGVDKQDAGIAVSEIHASPTQQFGTAQIVFPSQGTYQVIAVDGSNNNLGTSNNVVAVALPSASSTVLGATPTSSASVSSQLSNASSTRPDTKVPIIVGSILGALILLAILVTLIMFHIRRRRKTTQRWIFHKNMMVQNRQPFPVMAQTSPSSSFSTNTTLHSQDLEQGLAPIVPTMKLPTQDPEPCLPGPVVYPTRMAGLRGQRPILRQLELDPSHHTPPPRPPIGPRLPIILTPRSSLHQSARAVSPALRSPSPRTHRQRAIADQIEILRIQMLELERRGGKDYIGMGEMTEKMAWLRDQQEGSWALGLTEVAPVGYHRYMT